MKNYEIISHPSKKGKDEEWIYLIGTLKSEAEVETAYSDEESYAIKTFSLSYKYPNKPYLYETFGYNVLIIGRLKSPTEIVVHLIFDSPDVTGRGIVCLTRMINNECVPIPFVYLPMKENDTQISKHLSLLKSPFFALQKDLDADFVFIDEKGNHMSINDFKEIDIILPEAGGYDMQAPAFYLGIGKNAVSLKKEKVKKNSDDYVYTVVFKGKQMCKR